MRVVRFGAFETNSSSMHSIVVVNNNKPNYNFSGLKIIDNKLYIQNEGDIEFGRHPFRVLSTFAEKLMYAIASFKKDIIINAVGNILNINDIVYPTVCYWGSDGDNSFTGYIDHQSDGILNNFLAKNNISLKDFLTQNQYMIIIDGDEYCIFDKMVESGIITDDIKK